MTTAANLSQLKQAYQRWHSSKGGDSDCWLEMMSDNVQIKSTGAPIAALAFAQDRHSKSEAVAYLTGLLKDWSMVHWTPETFVAEGDKIAVFSQCAWINKATGKKAEVRTAHLWEFRNGKITSLVEIFDTAKAIAAATP